MRNFSSMLAALALLALPGAASAEIYKCPGRDGATLFTTDESLCPGAEAHALQGSIQRTAPVPPAAAAPSAPARLDDPGTSEDRGREARWRAKKAQAQHDLAEVTQRLEDVRRAVGWCNRGSELYVEDASGIRRELSCDEVDREYEELQEVETQLQAYLEEGLEEDCRRAGCLPGWIRD